MFSMYFTSATFYRTYNLEGFIVTLPDQYIKSLQRYIFLGYEVVKTTDQQRHDMLHEQ